MATSCSQPPSAVTKAVPVEGTVRFPSILSVDVDQPPHADEDGVAACRLLVEG